MLSYDFWFIDANRTIQNIRINIMQGHLEQKYRQVFEIKIKQERLCQLLQNFNLKIRHLQENQKALQNSMSMSNILDEVKNYVKGLVKQQSTQMIYKFYEKIQVCNKDINRIQYSFKNFEKNMRAQFESLNEKEKLLEKTVSYLNSNEIMKLKNELEAVNSTLLLSKSELMGEINVDRQKFGQIHQKFQSINELLENGQEKLQTFQETISSLGKRLKEIKNVQSTTKEQMIDERQNQRERQKQRLPPPQIIKKSRISARRTIDNTAFQKSFDQIRQSYSELKEPKEPKQGKQIRKTRDSKENELHTIQKKLENLQRRVSGITDCNNSVPTAQNIPNERESILSTQQLLQFSKFDSAQNVDRGQMKSSMKRNSSNIKRGSIRTEDNRQSGIQEYGRSNFAASNNNNEIRKINQRLTSLHFKITLMEENYDALLSKISKLGSLEANVTAKIEEAEKIRVDVNTINEIKLRFKQIQTSMQLEELRYVNHSTYQKQIESIYKKISAIDVVLPAFAKKEEVVSAFTFVQNKIKEIVIVLSNKFEEEKMGAINKIQNIRCLTCDRQTHPSDLTRPNTKANPRNCQNNRMSYDRTQIAKRIKTDQNQ